MSKRKKIRARAGIVPIAGALASLAVFASGEALAQGATCERELTADVVALDQTIFYNRIGSVNPAGMMYALRTDVVDRATGKTEAQGGTLQAGRVALREDKRPRPLTLRMNVGDCLTINFQNLLAPARVDGEQPATRTASVHAVGLDYVNGPSDDGAFVGRNPSSLAAPGQSATYKYRAGREGAHLFYSTAATTGGEGDGGTIAYGLFGAINVEPKGAEWYRSQVTQNDLALASVGTLPTGHPKIDYDAKYPAGHPLAGLPIISMLVGNKIVHGDLNAVITGPQRGQFPAGTFPPNVVLEPNASVPQAPNEPLRSREEPFREHTSIWHDEAFAVQAFPEFEDPVLGFTLHGVRDGFGINYGIAGAGNEILANRKGVGPTADCAECKYEEFFLTSWAGGDPATIVDIPANAPDDNGELKPGHKATKAFYPDDPSNVFHSYLGDHVKIRNLHAGPKEHHIFHLHAHQWLFTPDSDNSNYLDSQAIGPGSAYNYEIAFNGSGNRNQTAGDSIYHCHFYPHFAQGMWYLWRVHDVFEAGTELDGDGRPTSNARALPDGEIKAGTPIPAVVPLPTLAMAPLPATVHVQDGKAVIAEADKNPGFPFFIPGEGGRRPPKAPLDTVHDGGLRRHIVHEGEAVAPAPNRFDFSKTVEKMKVQYLPEDGTAAEKAAMNFHATRVHQSLTPDGKPRGFITNGQPPKPGAPYADPCTNDWGTAMPESRTYKAAAIQLDMTLNKAGWHHPQSRMLSLWGDVDDFINGRKPPEPFFFRANSDECVVFHHTNLLPGYYELDDFQVRTPTDVVGQHIHLLKFDVMAADGSGNGWNYEDGTMSPDEIRERIAAIRRANGCNGELTGDATDGTDMCPIPTAHPFFGEGPDGRWLGAQTTVQRWYADGITANNGYDRTLQTIFTHDHFGPSTHQQVGLYAGFIIEPKGSVWRDSETGQTLGGRTDGDGDGGPTRFMADIITPNAADSFREYAIGISDFVLAYEAGGGVAGGNPVPDPAKAINPPGRREVGLPYLLSRPNLCPGGVAPPCPETISADDPGTFAVSYRNEPLALRLRDPQTNTQAAGPAGDAGLAFRSDIDRAMPELNNQPDVYDPLTSGVQGKDPFTPLLRAYKGDRIKIRMLAGGHEEGHIASIPGLKWLREADDPASGWRSAQMLGISEHFEFNAPIVPPEGELGDTADYLYALNSSVDGFWNGAWGLMRTYEKTQPDLKPLPSNPIPANGLGFSTKLSNRSSFSGVCPVNAPVRRYAVSAVSAQTALPGGALVYNSRNGAFPAQPGPLKDPTAILYVNDTDLNNAFKLKAGVPVEPLVLRANAGDCIEVQVTNRLPAVQADLDGYNAFPMLIEQFNANQLKPSSHVGLQPQLLATDVTRGMGMNIGLNAVIGRGARDTMQTVLPGQKRTYRWYAGDLSLKPNGTLEAKPIEFGTVNLMPADPLKQSNKGLIGALIIEPKGSTWTTDANSRLSATVKTTDGKEFREFVMLFQDDVNMRDANNRPICPVTGGGDAEGGPEAEDEGEEPEVPADPLACQGLEDSEDSGNKAINYRSEPMWFRMGHMAGASFQDTRDIDFTNHLSNQLTGGDPQTPVFTAKAGQQVRFRVLQPGGHMRNGVFQVHGHSWQREPYAAGAFASERIASNPLSEWTGTQEGTGPANHFDFVLNGGAGGAFAKPGDYLIRNQASYAYDAGQWGILRVTP
ncbi:MAG TPA: hypothetical protein VD978_29435 [Azospirillum sp.]|nr:hypothetical protein [Azospirillum sp.]